ncbi:MAG: tape measure protein, partial [Bacteroidota bacterium]
MASQLLIRVGIRLDNFEKGIKTIERKMSRLSSRLSRLGSDLSTNISLPVAGVATAAVSAFAKLERLENGLKAIADEGEDTAKTLERLQRIAQLPGISLEQAIQGSNQLRNVGFEARQAEIILRELSKAVTLSGAGPEQLQSVVRQLVQMSSKGRILQEDLGVILENVPSVGIAIQDAFGTQSVEAIRATGVSAQEFTAKIIQAISANEKFQNVQGGLANDFDNFRQSVIRSLAALGRSIAESI